MLDSIILISQVLALVIGIVLFLVGRAKKNNKLIGAGIGFVVCLVIVVSPQFVDGFIKGWNSY